MTVQITIFLSAVFILCFHASSGNEPKRPSFPDDFTVDVEAIFVNDNEGADIRISYDRINNRGALDWDSQAENTKTIFRFNDNEILTINGITCTIDKISDDPDESIFPFHLDENTGAKIIAPPEDFFYFQNSKYVSGDVDGTLDIPVFVYKGVADMFGEEDCNVTHIFSKPEFSASSCDLRSCESVLLRGGVTCLSSGLLHRYEFSKFHAIVDDEVFQAPKGVFCLSKHKEVFPVLPNYFSLSYNIYHRQTDVADVAVGQYIQYFTVWYDADAKMIRTDNYDGNGRLTLKKLYDFQNNMMYDTLPGIEKCTSGEITETIPEITSLPEVIFPWVIGTKSENKVFVGEREVEGIQYMVWAFQAKNEDKLRLVDDVYYMKESISTSEDNAYEMKLAFIQQYEYGADYDSPKLALQETRFITFHKHLVSPHDWTKFDISDCFEDELKAFEFEISGSDVDELLYDYLIEALYQRILKSVNVTVLRIGKFKMISRDDTKLSFTGVIIGNGTENGSNQARSKEKIFESLKSDVYAGLFYFNFSVNDEDFYFNATYFGQPKNYTAKETKKENEEEDITAYSGGAMAGLGIVMLVLGGIVGGIGVLIFIRTRQTGNRLIA